MKNLIILLVALLTITGMLFAQPTPNPNVIVPPQTNGNPNLKQLPPDLNTPKDWFDDLKLNENQKQKLGELRLAHQKDMNTKDADLENAKLDVMQALKKEDFKNAKELAKAITLKQQAKEYARIDFYQAILMELTPEQKDKFKEAFLMRMGHEGGKGMGMGMGKCPCMMQMMQGQCSEMQMEGTMNCPDCNKPGDSGMGTGNNNIIPPHNPNKVDKPR
jgi:Spy/CpxP family protein refolding chaperone